MRRARAIVSGRVQGVSYRASCASEARRIGVVGWVRNLPDGTVELEAEGTSDQVARFLAWCEQGPPAARVERIAVEDQPPKCTEAHFAVVR